MLARRTDRPTDRSGCAVLCCAVLLRSFSPVRTCGCESLRIAEEAERLRQLVILQLRKSRQTECPQLVTATVERAPHAIIAGGKGAHGACRCEEGNGTSRRTRRPSEESSCAIASESFSGAVGPIRYWQCRAVQCSAVQCSAEQCRAVQCFCCFLSCIGRHCAVQCSAVQCSVVLLTRRERLCGRQTASTASTQVRRVQQCVVPDGH